MEGSKVYSLRQKFKTNIRREVILSRFQQERNNLITACEIQTAKQTLSILGSQGDISSQEINNLLYILDQNTSTASFVSKAVEHNLPKLVVATLLNKNNRFSQHQKSCLLSALDYLTYYSVACIQALVHNERFIDYLREEAEWLKLDEPTQLEHLHRIVTLLMNLSSQLNSDFILYIAESDVITTIIKQLSNARNILNHKKSQEYEETLKPLRLAAVKLFTSIISGLKNTNSFHIAVKLVLSILQDKQYFQELPARMLLLLSEGMTEQPFWMELFRQSEGLTQQIVFGAEYIQERCFGQEFLNNKDERLAEEQYQDFKYLLTFFINLFSVKISLQSIAVDWQMAVQNFLNGFMLAQFLIETHQKNHKELIYLALNAYSLLAQSQFVSTQQLLVIRPADNLDLLFRIWTDPKLLKTEEGRYSLRILRHLLQKDGSWHYKLMEMRIMDVLEDIFSQNDSEVLTSLVCQALALLTILVQSNEDGRILMIFENKGMQKQLTRLQDNNNKTISLRVELFFDIQHQYHEKKDKKDSTL